MTQAQSLAVGETRQWLAALLRDAGWSDGLDRLDTAGLVGVAVNGRPLSAFLPTSTVGAYLRRIGLGQGEEMAEAAAVSWLNRMGGSEPFRSANEATLRVCRGAERFTCRVSRITRPGACEFCELIADRGYIPHGTPEHPVTFAAHANCRCTASPEITQWATSRPSVRRGRAANRGGMVSAVPSRGGEPPEDGGGGGTGGTGGGGQGEGGDRGLLTDDTAPWRRDDLPMPGTVPATTARRAPTYAELLAEGVTLGGTFSARELPIAQRLAELGIDVVRMQERPGPGQTPDAAIVGRPMTVELKTMGAYSLSSMSRSLREGRGQSRRVVVDARNVDLTRGDATRWLRASLDDFGGDLDEVLILGNGFGILWP